MLVNLTNKTKRSAVDSVADGWRMMSNNNEEFLNQEKIQIYRVLIYSDNSLDIKVKI